MENQIKLPPHLKQTKKEAKYWDEAFGYFRKGLLQGLKIIAFVLLIMIVDRWII